MAVDPNHNSVKYLGTYALLCNECGIYEDIGISRDQYERNQGRYDDYVCPDCRKLKPIASMAEDKKPSEWVPIKEYKIERIGPNEQNGVRKMGKFGSHKDKALWFVKLEGVEKFCTFLPENEAQPPAVGTTLKLHVKIDTWQEKQFLTAYTEAQYAVEKSGGKGGFNSILPAKAATMQAAAMLATRMSDGNPVDNAIAAYRKLWAEIDKSGGDAK